MKRKKVIIIGPIPPPYHGVTVYTNNIIHSEHLKKEFHVIHFDTSDHRTLKNIGSFDFKNIMLALYQLSKYLILLIKIRPDIIYIPISQNYSGYLRDGLFIFLGKLFSLAKIFIHLHGSYFKTFYNHAFKLFRMYVDYSIKKVNNPIVLGNSLKTIFFRWFKKKNIFVLPNGTELNPEISKKNLSKSENINIGYLGNLMEEKGIFDSIKALKILKDRGYNVKLQIAGSWDPRGEEFPKKVMNFIKKNNLTAHLKFLGVLTGKEKSDFLIDSDIFIFPTYYHCEGHPIVIIEAMSAANPVISTKVGAIPETVTHGESGFLIEPRDIDKLAENIEVLLNNNDLRKKMGLRGRQLYEEKYTLEKNIKNLITILNH